MHLVKQCDICARRELPTALLLELLPSKQDHGICLEPIEYSEDFLAKIMPAYYLLKHFAYQNTIKQKRSIRKMVTHMKLHVHDFYTV